MKTRALQNYGASVGLEVYDLDWNNQEEILELGRLAASQCVLFINDSVPFKQLATIMDNWGESAGATMFDYIGSKKIEGRHWRDVYLALGYTTTGIPKDLQDQVAIVTYKKDEKGRALGAFSNGELNWHSDQCAFDDAQRVIGLMSISDSANSQTTFLCTHDAYESLSSDMKSMAKELVVRHKWRDGIMAPGLNSAQTLVIHYNMVPLDGMETQLYRETASGLPGLKMPSHSFDGFVGMSQAESDRVIAELRKVVFQDKYVYTCNWQDGQTMFMDQEITLHARPTNVLDGNKRTMARLISYVNKIYPDKPRTHTVRYNGEIITHDHLAELVDLQRKEFFETQQQKNYASQDDEVYSHQ
jgi:alpha-ketoglutarate-dependent taurine dioxygenase